MDLMRKLVKDFAEIVNTPSDNTAGAKNIKGTVVVRDGVKRVRLDGAPDGSFDSLTPISEATDVQDGDRVLLSIENHTATVIGNFSNPATHGAGEHVHEISDITNLKKTLDGKADDDHEHDIDDITNLKKTLDDKSPKNHEHEKLNKLAGIYEIGDNLALTDEGKLSATGGGGITGDTLPIGSIIEWANNTAPINWLLLNGQAVSRTEYSELFELYGTTYGPGDGSTTFNLPDYRTRVPVGYSEGDSNFGSIGKTGGEAAHTLTVDEIPNHHHPIYLSNTAGATSYGLSYDNKNGAHFSNEWAAGEKIGGDQPHNNLQPYIVTNFIVKAKQSAGIVADVVNNLESTSPTDALSANQGRVLNEKVSELQTDYIVKQGVSGIWTYRKWASGIAELWNASPINETWNSASGAIMGGYYAQLSNPSWGVFPFTFVDIPNATGGGRINTGAGFLTVMCTTTGISAVSVTGNQNSTNVRGVSIFIRGRWK